ncbi:MAG TPA: glutamate--tRNA ligase [Desulfobacteraceae bacterium]|nr:glutamate--tRNA ligase [Desulfobacteraceae bacterium]
MTEKVVVRFAPSPTGYLHIGGARTAIFNWLFARKMGGKFILRIEDTDYERSTEESIREIIGGLKWLGIDWDEGPYFQSEHIEEHIEAAKRLLESGHAYKCFCTKEELERKRKEAIEQRRTLLYDGACRRLTEDQIREREEKGIPYTIRLKVPRDGGSVVFEDIVYGHIEKRHDDIEDFVIVRSNGKPLYVLSNAVDDIRDGITHVIRGQDGLANTPKQILIYRALGAPIPRFAHMPLTLDPKKAKISKRRHGEVVSVRFYREHGFLPWAMVNFLVLLGWSTPDSKQIFSKEELIEAFSLEGISRANAIFDIRKDDPKFFTDPKAISINAHYIRNMPVDELIVYVKEELKREGLWDDSYDREKREWFLKTVDLIRSRFHTLKDFVTRGRAYFSDDFTIEKDALKKNLLRYPELKEWLPELAERLERLSDFSERSVEDVIRAMAGELGVKVGVLTNGIRAVLTGQRAGPGLFEIMALLGRGKVVDRLRNTRHIFGGN